MSGNLTDLVAKGTSVVCADGVAARQVEGYLARMYAEDGRTAWLDSPVRTYRDWVVDTWRQYLDDGSRQLLSPRQVDALWRRVIEESGAGEHVLIGFRHAASWAREASRRRRDWDIHEGALHAYRSDPDCGAFLRWERRYRKILDDSGWMDAEDAALALAARAPGPDVVAASVIWADLTLTPSQARLSSGLQSSGHDVAKWAPPSCNERCRRVQLAESADEVQFATAWAADALARNPAQRVAIVVPGPEEMRNEIISGYRRAGHTGGGTVAGQRGAESPVFLQGQPPALEDPVIAAAMNALELFTDAGDFQVLSRWLRSPFFGVADGDVDARCMLEARLRTHISSRLNFRDGFRSGGLREAVWKTDPPLAGLLDEVIALMNRQPRRATPAHWGTVWSRMLGELGWNGSGGDSAIPDDWESALNELALLGPVLGKLAISDALSELESILAQPGRHKPMPLHGLFVLSDPENVGPGFDAVWVCGLTDSQWPRAAQPAPLLPVALQRERGMPSASPLAALDQSREIIRRLVNRVPDVVLSSPEMVHDHRALPSPLITSFPAVDSSELAGKSPLREQWKRSGIRPLEALPDPVPPVRTTEVRGGIGTLSTQAICPLRAFIASRLRAAPLEPVRPGLSAVHRGVTAHAAAQQLFIDFPDRDAIETCSPEDRARRIDRSCRQAMKSLFGRAERPLASLFEFELARLRLILAKLLELELTRPSFRVASLEESVRIVLGGLQWRGRIDRIDELGSNGELAIIDYKTGTSRGPGVWLTDRPRDLQLPAYACAQQRNVAAVVISVLKVQSAAYRGFWNAGEGFPGKPARLPGKTAWIDQLETWRAQLEALACEFASGDGRIFEGDLEAAGGPYAPLTRVHDQRALARASQP